MSKSPGRMYWEKYVGTDHVAAQGEDLSDGQMIRVVVQAFHEKHPAPWTLTASGTYQEPAILDDIIGRCLGAQKDLGMLKVLIDANLLSYEQVEKFRGAWAELHKITALRIPTVQDPNDWTKDPAFPKPSALLAHNHLAEHVAPYQHGGYVAASIQKNLKKVSKMSFLDQLALILREHPGVVALHEFGSMAIAEVLSDQPNLAPGTVQGPVLRADFPGLYSCEGAGDRLMPLWVGEIESDSIVYHLTNNHPQDALMKTLMVSGSARYMCELSIGFIANSFTALLRQQRRSQNVTPYLPAAEHIARHTLLEIRRGLNFLDTVLMKRQTAGTWGNMGVRYVHLIQRYSTDLYTSLQMLAGMTWVEEKFEDRPLRRDVEGHIGSRIAVHNGRFPFQDEHTVWMKDALEELTQQYLEKDSGAINVFSHHELYHMLALGDQLPAQHWPAIAWFPTKHESGMSLFELNDDEGRDSVLDDDDEGIDLDKALATERPRRVVDEESSSEEDFEDEDDSAEEDEDEDRDEDGDEDEDGDRHRDGDRDEGKKDEDKNIQGEDDEEADTGGNGNEDDSSEVQRDAVVAIATQQSLLPQDIKSLPHRPH